MSVNVATWELIISFTLLLFYGKASNPLLRLQPIDKQKQGSTTVTILWRVKRRTCHIIPTSIPTFHTCIHHSFNGNRLAMIIQVSCTHFPRPQLTIRLIPHLHRRGKWQLIHYFFLNLYFVRILLKLIHQVFQIIYYNFHVFIFFYKYY